MANNEPIGARLKRTRLEKGISLEEAHKGTKIHLDVLKAIEDDNYINLNPVYLKGFLKIYCQFLGVELPAAVSQKKPAQADSRADDAYSHPPGQDISGRRQPVNQKAGAAPQAGREEPGRARALPVAEITRRLVPVAAAAAVVLVAVALVFFAGKAAVRMASHKKARHSQSAPVKKEKIAAMKARAAAKPRPSGSVVQAKRIPQEEGLRLGVRALEDCWLQLKADNKVVFQNILKKGRFESWEASDRMDLVLGSAGSVQVEINGKIMPSLGKRGQVLRDIAITRKDGLKVGK